MTFEIKDGRGSLFANNRKEADSHPDLTGTIKIDGTEYWLSAWKQESAKGVKYLSLSVKAKEAKAEETKAAAVDFDDALPF
jgi:hypothetical protein